MNSPTSRALAVLELLQAQPTASGAEIARRIEVDRRTVRRYVAHLQALGIPIEAQRGRDGGYALRAGYKLPPMMFNADEALALSVGLRAASELGLHGITPAIASTQAKLARVLPAPLRKRLADIEQTVALDLGRPVASPSAAALPALSAAARAQQTVRIAYLSANQERSEREVDVYGLAYRGGAWYAVGHCHLRQDIRSFRLDRVTAVEAAPRSFGRPAGFDVLATLEKAIATLPRAHAVEVHLTATPGEARRAISAEFGELRADADGTRLFVQADDLEWVARMLSGLRFDFTIVKPAALRRAVMAHAQALLVRAARRK